MNVDALQPNPRVTDVPIERLAGNHALTEKEKVAEASRQFEALLLRQILSETQKTVIPSSLCDNSTAASIYRDMVTNQLADSISKSGCLGLARSIERQLDHQLPPASPAGQERPAESLPTSHSEAQTVRPIHFTRFASQPVGGDGSHPANAAISDLHHP